MHLGVKVCFLQFVNNNQALATLPGDGVGQNLITLAPCAINQPHVHPRGTEISHITKGKPCGLPTLSAQLACCTEPYVEVHPYVVQLFAFGLPYQDSSVSKSLQHTFICMSISIAKEPPSSPICHVHAAGEMLFGFIEENANRADTAGGRFINATVSAGQTFFIPQGSLT